jgi:hypothetical protein
MLIIHWLCSYYDASLLQMTYEDFWTFLAKTLSPLRTSSRREKVFSLIMYLV